MTEVRMPPPPIPESAPKSFVLVPKGMYKSGGNQTVDSRNTMSMIILWDTADKTDPTRKKPILVRRIIFRPKISDRRPYSGWHAVDVRRYAVPTHDSTDAS
jgi:hypothetical protein